MAKEPCWQFLRFYSYLTGLDLQISDQIREGRSYLLEQANSVFGELLKLGKKQAMEGGSASRGGNPMLVTSFGHISWYGQPGKG